MTLRLEQVYKIYTVIAACVITTINGECIDAPSYRGTLNVTLDGYTCQRWHSQQPHQHTRNTSNHFPNDASVNDAHNYCRDADGNYTQIFCKLCESNFSDAIWCYTTDTEIIWDYCVNTWDTCPPPPIALDGCTVLPENKNSTHCPNDTSFYWCKPDGIYDKYPKSILYDFECGTYVCCPPYPMTTHQSLSSTDSPEQSETPVACCQSKPVSLESMVKNETSLSGPVEGSTIAPNTSAENSQQRLQVAIAGLVTCICFNLYF